MKTDNMHNPKSKLTSKENIQGGYELPPHYFEDLKANVMASVGQSEMVNWKSSLRSAAGFVAGFAAMVLLALGIVQLTPDSALKGENMQTAENKEVVSSENLDNFMFITSVSEDDVLDYIFERDQNSSDEKLSAAVVDEYVSLYGGVDDL